LRIKSDSAEERINMGKTLGYMVTWTTYGTWLQGDKRSFVGNGEVLGENKELEAANKEAQENDAVILNRKQRQVITAAILEEARNIGEKILAISVRSNHAHIVIEGGMNPVDEVVSRFKNAGYFALRSKEGICRRIWTRGYDKRFCFDKGALQARIKYANKGQERKVTPTAGVGGK
jgi:REP element-mobilizing transposase RayT